MSEWDKIFLTVLTIIFYRTVYTSRNIWKRRKPADKERLKLVNTKFYVTIVDTKYLNCHGHNAWYAWYNTDLYTFLYHIKKSYRESTTVGIRKGS